MASLQDYEGYIRERVEVDHVTHQQLSEELQRFVPSGTRGFSVRSIKRFCSEHGIHKTSRLTDTEVATAVANASAKVVSSYMHAFSANYYS